jgi:hypothetical protein
MKTKSVHARINQNGLAQIADYFNQNPKTTLAELLQNSRRAHATQVEITAVQAGEDALVTVTDNGKGIEDEETLMELWKSGWDSETCQKESPAGFGFFALSCLPKGVTVRSKTWEMHVDKFVFEGKGPATSIQEKPEFTGTRLTFHLPDTKVSQVDQYVESVSKYYPVPVRYNKRAMNQGDFLKGANHIEVVDGLRIGVYYEGNSLPYNCKNINFYGVRLRHTIPCPHRGWEILLDVEDAKMVNLVKPTRNHVIENQRWLDTLTLVRKAVYEACKARGEHHLPFCNWEEAISMGVDLPEAKAELRLSTPSRIHADGWDDLPLSPNYPHWLRQELKAPVPNKNSILCDLSNSDIAALHLSEREVPIMFDASTNMEGYSWYPQRTAKKLVQKIKVGTQTIRFETEGEMYAKVGYSPKWKRIRKMIQNKTQPENVMLELHVEGCENNEIVEIETDIAFAADESGSEAVSNWIGTEKGTAEMTSGVLNALFFYESDSYESDSVETQEQEFEEFAEEEIIRRKFGEEAGLIHIIETETTNYKVRDAMNSLGIKSFTVRINKKGSLEVVVPKGANTKAKTKPKGK